MRMTPTQEARIGRMMQNENRFRVEHPREAEWLFSYDGNFPFYHSLRKQVENTGQLSDKQVQKIREAIQRDEQREARKNQDYQQIKARQEDPDNFTFQPGEKIEITKGIAKSIQQNEQQKGRELPVVFRNLQIERVRRETAKAILVDVRFVAEVVRSCHVCGMPLDTEVSRACGIGPVCAKRIGFERPHKADASDILRHVERFANDIGVLEEIWLPKSRITRIAQ